MQEEIISVLRDHEIDVNAFFSSLPPEKQAHSRCVAQMTTRLLELVQQELPLALDVSPALAGEAALYHDIGFVLIPHRLVGKREDLTAPEFRVLQQHTSYGASILEKYRKHNAVTPAQNAFWTLATEIALSHHERWDGKGYPFGQMTTAISVAARAVAIVGAFDDMIRGAHYRIPLPQEYALLEIVQNASSQFDPLLAKLFHLHYHTIFIPTTTSEDAV